MNSKEKMIKDIDEMLAVQFNEDNDDYMRGMYNGMEFVRTMIANCEAVYQEQDGNLDRDAAERSPERYI